MRPTHSDPPEGLGPDLTTAARPRNAARLRDVVDQLDVVADVAAGKLTAAEVPVDWLKLLAARSHGDQPAAMLDRWLLLFADELDVVRRARNNIVWKEPISDVVVAAALQIAERLLELAKDAKPDRDPAQPSG